MMDDKYEDYYNYLRGRRRLALIYRWLVVYPRIVHHLSGRVLDVGCGIGDFVAFRKNTVGFDIDPNCVAHCHNRGLEAIHGIDLSTALNNERFDGAVLDNVLEHLDEPGPLLQDLARTIRPGGTLVVGVPGVVGYAADPDHRIFYDEQDLIRCLQANGYRWRESFFAPFRSMWCNRNLKQYCVYGVFDLNA